MRSGLIWGLSAPSAVRRLRIEARGRRAVGITVLVLSEQRLVARHPIAQPLAGSVSEGTGALGVDSVPLSELLQVDLRHAPHRLADLIRHGAQPILEAVVFAHALHVGR
jgi:hypothetical protein